MSILLTRMSVVSTWFVVIITFALRRRPNAPWAMDVQRMWHRARPDQVALGVDADAQDLMRMDSDKG